MSRFARSETRERGFTLVEILVVVAIIGILSAIAIPTFIGAKRNGYDSHAQASLRSALSAERTYYVDYQAFTQVAADLQKIEPNLSYVTTDAEAQGVMVAVAGNPAGSAVVLVSTSKSGNQFCIMNIAQTQTAGTVNGQNGAGTYYKKKTGVTTPPTSVTTDQCGTTGYVTTDAGWR